MPVKTMARPASSAASITFWSFIEPPGWITAVAPASATTSNPSGKGKKASDAAAEPMVRGLSQPAILAASLALMAAMRADAGGRTILHIDDGIGLHMLADGEGQQHVGDLLLRGLAPGHHLQAVARDS